MLYNNKELDMDKKVSFVVVALALVGAVMGYLIISSNLLNAVFLLVYTAIISVISMLCFKYIDHSATNKKSRNNTTPINITINNDGENDIATLGVVEPDVAVAINNLDIDVNDSDSVLLDDLKAALTNDSFFLNYQPKIRLDNGTFVGFEALIRWTHPTKGAISPATFIPLAIKHGLIIDIGKWVINEVCRSMDAWKKEGLLPLPISINLCDEELYNKDLLKYVIETCKKHNIERNLLEFEILGMTYLSNRIYFINLINQFKSEGFSVSLDNFSTDINSIEYLKDIPCDCIKLDKNFLKIAKKDTQAISIVEKIIELANALELSIICEGVETHEQVELLIQLGCTMGQGYHLAMPMIGQDAREYLKYERDIIQDELD